MKHDLTINTIPSSDLVTNSGTRSSSESRAPKCGSWRALSCYVCREDSSVCGILPLTSFYQQAWSFWWFASGFSLLTSSQPLPVIDCDLAGLSVWVLPPMWMGPEIEWTCYCLCKMCNLETKLIKLFYTSRYSNSLFCYM